MRNFGHPRGAVILRPARFQAPPPGRRAEDLADGQALRYARRVAIETAILVTLTLTVIWLLHG